MILGIPNHQHTRPSNKNQKPRNVEPEVLDDTEDSNATLLVLETNLHPRIHKHTMSALDVGTCNWVWNEGSSWTASPDCVNPTYPRTHITPSPFGHGGLAMLGIHHLRVHQGPMPE